jgi:hypothetical protein
MADSRATAHRSKNASVTLDAAMLTTAKQDALKVLNGLPDDASLEDIQYHLYVLQRVTEGREDVAAGRLVPQDEFERRIARWLDT